MMKALTTKAISRSRTMSISWAGVAIPLFDFFWNAWMTHRSSPS